MSDNKTVMEFTLRHTPDNTVRATALASRSVANQKYDDYVGDWPPVVALGRDLVEKDVTAVTGGGTTVTTSGYTTGYQAIIQNLDPTNYVTATYRTAAGGVTDQNVRIYPNTRLVLPEFTKASNILLVADTADCKCRIAILKV